MKAQIRFMILIAVVAVSVSGLVSAHAAPVCVNVPTPIGTPPVCVDTPGGDPTNPCEQGRPGDQGNPLCPNGPAGCVAIGLYLNVTPLNLTTQLSRSTAYASAFGGYGFGGSDAHQQRADIPGTLGEGVVESHCGAMSQRDGTFSFNSAGGDADTSSFYLSLYPYSVPLIIFGDVLHETGYASSGGGGSNDADIESLNVYYSGSPVLARTDKASDNTSVGIPGVGTLYLNEKFAGTGTGGCFTRAGDALRLEVPAAGLRLILSWVANTAC